MDKTYALVGPDNKAKNFILCDGISPYAVNGYYLVEIVDGMRYGYEWEWNGTSFTPPQSPVTVIPEVISRRQCAQQLFIMGLITGPEAVDMARSGMPPAFVQASFNNLPQNDQYIAEINFAANTYDRSNPLLNSIMVANGNTQEELDQFFIDAAAL